MIGQDIGFTHKSRLKLKYYPYRAPKMRLFADDEFIKKWQLISQGSICPQKQLQRREKKILDILSLK
jgi:hypothetical protein